MPRRDDTFIIYYAEDFAEYETSNPSNLYCLSQSSIDIILSALRFATWPTRWRADRQDYRSKVSASEWQNLKKWGELAIQEVTYEMACDINESLDQINTTLEGVSGWLEQLTGITALIEQVTSIITELGDLAALATIATNTGNINTTLGGLELSPTTNVNVTNNHPITVSGGGSCSPNCAPGSGAFTPPDASAGQTTPGEGPGGYEPPENWGGTPEEYDAYKCKAATFIVDSYLTYVAKFSAFASIGLTAITVSMFFAPMPDKFMALVSPVLAFALFAYLLTVAIAGNVLAGYLGTYYSNLNSVRDDTICELYNATSVGDARTAITNWLTDNLPAGLGSVPGFVDYHVSSLFTNEVLNILFDQYDALSDEPDGDCSNCDVGPGLLVIVGSGSELIEPDNQWVTLTSENVGGSVWMVRLSDQVEDGGTGHSYICEWRNYTSQTTLEMALGVEGPNNESVYGKYPSEIDDIEDPLEFNLRCGAWFQINSNFIPSGATQYTIEVRITDGC